MKLNMIMNLISKSFIIKKLASIINFNYFYTNNDRNINQLEILIQVLCAFKVTFKIYTLPHVNY